MSFDDDADEDGVFDTVFGVRRFVARDEPAPVSGPPAQFARPITGASLTGEAADILVELAMVPETEPALRATAARLLGAGVTLTRTAELLRLHVVTLMSWQVEPQFAEAMRQGAALRRERISHRAQDVALVALDQLSTMLESDIPAAVKLRAVEMALERIPTTSAAAIAKSASDESRTAPLVEVNVTERLLNVLGDKG